VVRLLGDCAAASCVVELFHELFVRSRVLDEVVEDAAETDRGGLRAGEDHAVAR